MVERGAPSALIARRADDASRPAPQVPTRPELLLRPNREFSQVPVRTLSRQVAPRTSPPKPAATGKVAYDEDASFKKAKLSTETWLFGMAYVKQTRTGQAIISWLESHGVRVQVHFVATANDMPAEDPHAAGYTERAGPKAFDIYVVAGQTRWRMENLELVGSLEDGDPHEVARTLLHELLHAWFQTRFTGRSYGRESGHTSEVAPPVIWDEGTSYDPESEYEPEFLEQLKQFDAEFRDQLRKEKSGVPREPTTPKTVPSVAPPR